MLPQCINPIDVSALKTKVAEAAPFPHFCIDNFLQTEFAESINQCFPSNDEVRAVGHSFNAVNEKGKTQVTDSALFPKPIQELNRVLASPEWLELLSDVMGIPKLQADSELAGGGIHQTGPRGRLDVHIDFNYIADRKLHRRLNILIYFNKGWQKEWGGNIELWDENVKKCHHSFSPLFNRCVVFETNNISYHGVTQVKTPPGVTRNSFAAYYYTSEAPEGWDGKSHSTIFKARPNEKIKGSILMPVEHIKRNWKSIVKSLIGRK